MGVESKGADQPLYYIESFNTEKVAEKMNFFIISAFLTKMSSIKEGEDSKSAYLPLSGEILL